MVKNTKTKKAIDACRKAVVAFQAAMADGRHGAVRNLVLGGAGLLHLEPGDPWPVLLRLAAAAELAFDVVDRRAQGPLERLASRVRQIQHDIARPRGLLTTRTTASRVELDTCLDLAGEVAAVIDLAEQQTPKKDRQHANGTLDERALQKAKRWQQEGRAWGPTELAKELGTYPPNLTGDRKGKPRCPLFFAFWQAVQQQRLEAKVDRHVRLPRGRK